MVTPARASSTPLDEKHRKLLASFQHLMLPHEQLAARWLSEAWDGSSPVVPRWLHRRIWTHFPPNVRDDATRIAREICLRLLSEHRDELRGL
jgi:hypothetical protein